MECINAQKPLKTYCLLKKKKNPSPMRMLATAFQTA